MSDVTVIFLFFIWLLYIILFY